MVWKRNRWGSLAATMLGLWIGAGGGTASADLVVNFNFEEQAIGNYTTITSTQSGLTATLSRVDGTDLGVVNLTSFGSPASWGSRSISNFVSSNTTPGGILVINFSQAVSAASLQFGDYDGDDDSPVTLTAYSGANGTGSALNSSSTSYPVSETLASGDSGAGSLSVSALGIRSIELSSGGTYPNSLYYDNLSATIPSVVAVPEPSTFVLAGTGVFAFLGYHFRHRKAKAAA